MNNPKCPYCGGEMKPNTGTGHNIHGNKTVWFTYCCDVCESESPPCDSRAEAYAAAMKRERKKGYLVYTAGHHWEEDGTDYPDICVYVNGRCSECGQVLCRAGETAIRYPKELMYTDKEWDYRSELIEAEDRLLKAATQRKVSIMNYCPNCGVEMRKEKDDE